MATSEDERNKKNAQILQSNVFHHDLMKIARAAIGLYDPKNHSKQFLHDSLEFIHLMVNMLEEYSKGKVLTIQTHRMKKVKKPKTKKRQVESDGDIDEAELIRAKKENEEEMDEDYNPN
jgi:hypothetical protein